MSADLFGVQDAPKEMRCFVYHDERFSGKRWLYHGFLFVPVMDKEAVLTELDGSRRTTGWAKEIHFKDLQTTRNENDCARLWIELFCTSIFRRAYYYFFGVDQSRLAQGLWKAGTRNARVYNRFFQIGLYGAIKWFFLNPKTAFERVEILKVFSDAKHRVPGDRFHEQPIQDLLSLAGSRQEPIEFLHKRIIEVESDHRKEKNYPLDSQLIQLADVLTGAMGQTIDNTSGHTGKSAVSRVLARHDIPNAVMNYHYKSPYYKRVMTAFFPRHLVNRNDLLDDAIFSKRDQFYNSRNLVFLEKGQSQFASVMKDA